MKNTSFVLFTASSRMHRDIAEHPLDPHAEQFAEYRYEVWNDWFEPGLDSGVYDRLEWEFPRTSPDDHIQFYVLDHSI